MKNGFLIGMLLFFICFVLVGCGAKENTNGGEENASGNDTTKYNTETCSYTAKDVPTDVEYLDESVVSSYGVLAEVRINTDYNYTELIYNCITSEGIEAYKEFIVAAGYSTTSTSSLCDKAYTKDGESAELIVNCYEAQNKMKITFQN